jgi:hypothetical protein
MKKLLPCTCLFLVLAANPSLADAVLTGKWKGTYTCSQGQTRAEIDIYDNSSAVFRFYASSSRYGAFDGIFLGKFRRTGLNVNFEPIGSNIAGWFKLPSGGSWRTIGFSSKLNSTQTSISGRVVQSGCTTINLTKAR